MMNDADSDTSLRGTFGTHGTEQVSKCVPGSMALSTMLLRASDQLTLVSQASGVDSGWRSRTGSNQAGASCFIPEMLIFKTDGLSEFQLKSADSVVSD